MSISPVDPLAALRAATGSLHSQLDSSLPLSRPDASLHDYVLHLRVLLRWFEAIEPALRPLAPSSHADALPDLAHLRSLAQRDLADAGWAEERSARVSPPSLQSAADASGAPSAFGWGTAYVLAGSQLGGQVLYRRLQGPLVPHALRYLAGEGAGQEVGRHWKSFVVALQASVSTPADVAAAVAGGVAAFEALTALFTAENVEVAL